MKNLSLIMIFFLGIPFCKSVGKKDQMAESQVSGINEKGSHYDETTKLPNIRISRFEGNQDYCLAPKDQSGVKWEQCKPLNSLENEEAWRIWGQELFGNFPGTSTDFTSRLDLSYPVGRYGGSIVKIFQTIGDQKKYLALSDKNNEFLHLTSNPDQAALFAPGSVSEIGNTRYQGFNFNNAPFDSIPRESIYPSGLGVTRLDLGHWRCIRWNNVTDEKVSSVDFTPQVVNDVKAYGAYPIAANGLPMYTQCAKLVIAENSPQRYKIGNSTDTPEFNQYSAVPWIITTVASTNSPMKCLTLKSEGIKFEDCGSSSPTNHVYPTQLWKVGGIDPNNTYENFPQMTYMYQDSQTAAAILIKPMVLMPYNSSSFLANLTDTPSQGETSLGNILAIAGFDYKKIESSSDKMRFLTNNPRPGLNGYPDILNTKIENNRMCLTKDPTDSFAVFSNDQTKCVRVDIRRYSGK